MKALFKFSICAVGSLILASSSFAGSQVYRIHAFAMDAANCQIEAQKIAQKFATVTGAVVSSAGCERPFAWQSDIVIRYSAEAALNLVSTHDDLALRQGTYATKAACEADLAAERALFERNTGLVPVASVCFAEGAVSVDNPRPFIARIDGFGTTSARPFVTNKSIYGASLESESTLVQLIQDSLVASGGIVSPRVSVYKADGLLQVVLKYYATRDRAFGLDVIGSFESVTVCQQNMSGLETLLQSFGVLGTKVFCTREDFTSIAPAYWIGTVSGAYSIQRHPQVYPTRAQCEADLTVLTEQTIRETESSHVQGFCSFERDDIWAEPMYFAKVLIER